MDPLFKSKYSDAALFNSYSRNLEKKTARFDFANLLIFLALWQKSCRKKCLRLCQSLSFEPCFLFVMPEQLKNGNISRQTNNGTLPSVTLKVGKHKVSFIFGIKSRKRYGDQLLFCFHLHISRTD